MPNETEARAMALAALDDLKHARSGRVRSRVVMRPESKLGRRHFDLASSSDAVVNLDQPASMVTSEIAADTKAADGETSESRRQVTETRVFPAEEQIYSRLTMSLSRADGGGSADETTQVLFDNTNEVESARWSVLSREVVGPNIVFDLASVFAYPELEVLLADPGQEVAVSHARAGQTLIDLPTEGRRIPKLLDAMQISEYAPMTPFTVRLVFGPQGLAELALLLSYSAMSSYLDLLDSVVVTFWRIGEGVTVPKPEPDECFPPVPPVLTAIAACDTKSSERYVSFYLDGRQYTDRIYWDADDDQPYVPLAAGDQLRITGSHRPYFRYKANKAITFNLWAAWKTDDDALIQDFRRDDSSDAHPRSLAYYKRVTDVVDQVVTLTDVQSIEEKMRVEFEDPLVGESDDDDYLMVDCSALIAAGAEVGTPVTLYGYNMPIGTLISRMELANGVSIP